MTRHVLSKVSIPFAVLLLATAALADSSDKQGKAGSTPLQLPIAGSVKPTEPFANAPFSGTLSVERFEARGTQVVAIVIVRGAVAGVGTALVGEVTLPVQVGPARQAAAQGPGGVLGQRGILRSAPRARLRHEVIFSDQDLNV